MKTGRSIVGAQLFGPPRGAIRMQQPFDAGEQGHEIAEIGVGAVGGTGRMAVH